MGGRSVKGGWSICEGRLESGPRVWAAGGCCEAGVMGTANEDGEENGLCCHGEGKRN